MNCPVCGYGMLVRIRRIILRPGRGGYKGDYAPAVYRNPKKLTKAWFLECESCGKIFQLHDGLPSKEVPD